MDWESAERVQKNDAGEFRALINGQWVSVVAVQKNDAGQFRIKRAEQPVQSATQTPAVQEVPLSQRWDRLVGDTRPQKELDRGAQVRQNAGAEIVAAIPDMFLNAPANLINLGNAAVGTGATALGRQDMAPPLMQPPNYARRAMEGMGVIQPQNAPQTPNEQYLSAMTQGATAGAPGGLPGMAIGGLSGLVSQGVSDRAGPQWGTVAGMATLGAGRTAAGIGRNRVAQAEALARQKAPEVSTLKEVRGAGYTIPPGQVRGVPWYKSIPNALLEKLGGKIATGQAASIKNEAVTDALSRKYIGASKNMELSKLELSRMRKTAAEPYEQIAKLSPQAAKTLEKLKQARFESNDYWKAYNRSGEPEKRITAQNWKAKADALESKLEDIAASVGRPDLVPKLRESRVEIAKIHEVENTLNTATGRTSARDYAKALEAGKPLSGGAATAGKMGQAYPRAVQENAGMPGVNQLTQLLGAGFGSGIGASLGGPAGAGIGGMAGIVGLPATQALARQLMLSSPYQRAMVAPNYGAGLASRGAAQLGTSPHVEALIAAMMSQRQNQR